MSSPIRRPQPGGSRPVPTATSVPPQPTPERAKSTTPSVRETWANRPRRTQPAAPVGRRGINTSSWVGALIAMVGVVAVLWIVQLVNAGVDYRLDRFGLRPRDVGGLWGVLTEPFLHANVDHMLSNTLPVVFVGWVLLLAGVRTWLTVTVLVVVTGGLLTWVVGPSNTVIVGASGMVFGWLGYLIARAVFSRQLKWIFVGIAVLFFFGTLLFGLFPTLNSNVSWQAHVCGFVAGILAAGLLHRRGETRFLGRSSVS